MCFSAKFDIFSISLLKYSSFKFENIFKTIWVNLGNRYSVEQEMYSDNQLTSGDRRQRFVAMKSLSTDSQRSSQSSGSAQRVYLNAAGKPVGGSYSTKALINPQPKLAEVAKMLLAAKEAGELPQASNKDLELQETNRLAEIERAKLLQEAQNGQVKNGRPAKPK